MPVRTMLLSVLAAVTLAVPGYAGETIVVHDAYIRSTTPTSPTGAAFMVLMNHSDSDDTLTGARSDIAKRVEIHTHIQDADGVMRMRQLEGGIVLKAGEMHLLERGGDHVMFMGLTESLEQGAMVTITLEFENAGDMTIDVPVDRERKAGQAHSHSGG